MGERAGAMLKAAVGRRPWIPELSRGDPCGHLFPGLSSVELAKCYAGALGIIFSYEECGV